MALMIAGLTRMETPPEPLAQDAPENVFSADRAYADLTDLLKENVAHPPGSIANKIIRDRIVAKMTARGFEVSIQADFACQKSWGSCSNVENIVTTKAGTTGKSTILVMSHYDSVPAGAGATDDGYGIASMLEIARVLSHDEAYENNLVFLFTDAEEVGLLGAEAFAANHPLMEQVSIIVNIESRGTSGTSAMFETGSDNDALLDIYQSATSHPVANSMTYEVYKRMPNDTDYSVFKRLSIPGFNFASSASGSRYHSVLDDLDHVNRSTLQHHGDNGLNMVRALGNMNLTSLNERSGDATYFDFYSIFLVKWPSSFNGPLSILGLLIVTGLITQGIRDKVVSFKTTLWSLGFILLSGVTVLGFTFLLSFPIGQWLTLHPIDHPNSWPGLVAVIATSFLAVLTVARFSYNRINLQSQTLITWLLLAIISTALSYTIGGVTYLTLAPLLAFLIGLSVDYFQSKRTGKGLSFIFSSHAGFFIATYLGFYHFKLLELVFNFDNSALRAAMLLVMVFTLLPIAQAFYRLSANSFKAHIAMLALIITIGSGISISTPGFTPEKPEPLNIVYVENANTQEAFYTLEPYIAWMTGTPTEHFETMGFPEEKKEYPLHTRRGKMRPQLPSTYLALTPPQFDIVTDITSDGERYIVAELSAGHSGHELTLYFNEGAPLQSISIKGEVPLDQNRLENGRINIGLSGTQEDTFRVKITATADIPFTLFLIEESNALPDTENTKDLIARRPIQTKANQMGDRSMVFRKIEF